MKNIKYFFQFLGIIFLILINYILGLKYSLKLSSSIFLFLGPLFKSKNISENNLIKAFPQKSEKERKKIINEMWINYGKIFAEYIFIKKFRKSEKFSKKIFIKNQEVLDQIKIDNEPEWDTTIRAPCELVTVFTFVSLITPPCLT